MSANDPKRTLNPEYERSSLKWLRLLARARAKQLSSAESKQGQTAAHRCKLGVVVVICPNRPFSRHPNRD